MVDSPAEDPASDPAMRRRGARAGFVLLLLALGSTAPPVSAQIIKWKSQESVAGGPHLEGYVGATVRFNASLDDYGLQGSYTFNPVNIDTLFASDRDDSLRAFYLRQTRIKFGATVRYEKFGATESYLETDFVGPNG